MPKLTETVVDNVIAAVMNKSIALPTAWQAMHHGTDVNGRHAKDYGRLGERLTRKRVQSAPFQLFGRVIYNNGMAARRTHNPLTHGRGSRMQRTADVRMRDEKPSCPPQYCKEKRRVNELLLYQNKQHALF